MRAGTRIRQIRELRASESGTIADHPTVSRRREIVSKVSGIRGKEDNPTGENTMIPEVHRDEIHFRFSNLQERIKYCEKSLSIRDGNPGDISPSPYLDESNPV